MKSIILVGILLLCLLGMLSGCSQEKSNILSAKLQNNQEENTTNLSKKNFIENSSSRILLDVPAVIQFPELPTGCEITSASMVLSYSSGVFIDKMVLLDKMPYSDEDPSLGFVGDPRSEDGYTIYPESLSVVYKDYNFTPVILTDINKIELENYIKAGLPVVLWLGGIHDIVLHAVVLTGFDGENYYINDPFTGEKNVPYNKDVLLEYWSNEDHRALGIL